MGSLNLRDRRCVGPATRGGLKTFGKGKTGAKGFGERGKIGKQIKNLWIPGDLRRERSSGTPINETEKKTKKAPRLHPDLKEGKKGEEEKGMASVGAGWALGRRL